MNIIVSGASRGIGKEIVTYLTNQGHTVIALARSEEALNDLSKTSEKIIPIVVDLLDKESLTLSLTDSLEKWSSVDIIINNAGALINKPFMDTSAEEFLQQYQSNVISAINLIQSCEGHLQAGSHIVNITSMGGFQGSSKFLGLSAYSASKGALSILSECLSEELKEKGVSVNALALGAVQTDMLAKAFPGYQAPLSPRQMASFIGDFALNSSEFINGKVIPVSLNTP